MFYDDLICSLTKSFFSKKTSKLKNELMTTQSDISNDASSKNSKFFANLKKLVILGKHYSKPIDEVELSKDIATRIWFTYRKGFSQINGNGPDSDQGWGCMIRCGQMLLAETFLRIYLSRDFRWESQLTGNPFYWKILSYFKDEKLAAYSIQQIALMGVSESIQIGKWFGPNAIAQVLNKLTAFEDSNHLRFYIAMDNCIFIDEIYETMKKCNKFMKCKQHPKLVVQKWDPLLLIIPLRLGLNEFNMDYKEPLKRCLELKQTVGMIGGKPNQAYYFYGYADDDLLYMDPHEVQPYLPNFVGNMDDSTYHTNTMWKLKFNQLDPSIALAFVCKQEEDFLDLIESLKNNVIKKGDMHSLFEICTKRPNFDEFILNSNNANNSKRKMPQSEDEFVLI